jgi:hypothetical protein
MRYPLTFRWWKCIYFPLHGIQVRVQPFVEVLFIYSILLFWFLTSKAKRKKKIALIIVFFVYVERRRLNRRFAHNKLFIFISNGMFLQLFAAASAYLLVSYTFVNWYIASCRGGNVFFHAVV